jgi:hypothetical protein
MGVKEGDYDGFEIEFIKISLFFSESRCEFRMAIMKWFLVLESKPLTVTRRELRFRRELERYFWSAWYKSMTSKFRLLYHVPLGGVLARVRHGLTLSGLKTLGFGDAKWSRSSTSTFFDCHS